MTVNPVPTNPTNPTNPFATPQPAYDPNLYPPFMPINTPNTVTRYYKILLI
jgi:hypothetical protein